ncbi:MAG: T9SS type A sorting domain-containing protein [Chitinophagales bacterium]
MKNILLILIISLFFIKNNKLKAQEKYFEKQYAWQFVHNGYDILPTNNGNYIISGSLNNIELNTWYCYTSVINQYGEQILTPNEYITIDYITSPKNMIKTEYGFFLGGGLDMPDNISNARTYYVMVNEQGEFLKSDTLGPISSSNGAYTCCRTSDNGYFLAGEILTGNGSGNIHPYLIKLNEEGVQVWDSIYYNYPGRAYFKDIIPATDGSGYYVLGGKNLIFTGTQGDIILLKIDELGDTIWEKTYDFNLQESVGKFKLKKDGGFIIHGNRSLNGGESPLVLELDSLGEIVQIANNYYNYSFYEGVIELSDSSLVFLGSAPPDNGGFDLAMQIVKLDKDFNLMWRRQFNGDGDDYGYDIIEALDGGFIISGRTESNTNGADLYVVKTNCMGLLTEPQAAFDYEAAGGIADFINESQYVYPDSIDGGHFLWHFGDETTSNEVSPSHEYVVNGHYTVTLTAVVCNDTSIYTQDVLVDGVGISENNKLLANQIHLFPNPASDFLQIETNVFLDCFVPRSDKVRMSIFNVLGEKVLVQDFSTEINISVLPIGSYFLQFENEKAMIVKRFVINR